MADYYGQSERAERLVVWNDDGKERVVEPQ